MICVHLGSAGDSILAQAMVLIAILVQTKVAIASRGMQMGHSKAVREQTNHATRMYQDLRVRVLLATGTRANGKPGIA